jgi:hypothetical protein
MEDAALEQPWIILQVLMDYCSPGVPNIIDSLKPFSVSSSNI